MNQIGQKIKEYRKKRDLTQEKLAEYLNVSFQAVSKWETGVAAPDLAMIVPLTRVLGVSADELLGITHEETDARREEIDKAYDNTYRTGDLEERYRIMEEAVAEYPGDMKYLEDFAWVVSNRSFSFTDDKTLASEQERAISLFKRVVEDCEDEKIRNSALLGLCQNLYFRDRREEARQYAELCTEYEDRLAPYYLTDEELTAFRERQLENHFMALIDALIDGLSRYESAADTAEKILLAMIPDGNFIWYHYHLYRIKLKQAKRAVQLEDYDSAAALLEDMVRHMEAYDECHFTHPGKYRFSAPFFEHLEVDTREVCHTGDDVLMHGLKEILAAPVFNPLREREDFKALERL